MAHTSLQIWGHHSDFISSYTESLSSPILTIILILLNTHTHIMFLNDKILNLFSRNQLFQSFFYVINKSSMFKHFQAFLKDLFVIILVVFLFNICKVSVQYLLIMSYMPLHKNVVTFHSLIRKDSNVVRIHTRYN